MCPDYPEGDQAVAEEDVIGGQEQIPDAAGPVDAANGGAPEGDASGDVVDAGTDDVGGAGSAPDETDSEPESLEAFLARNEAARVEHERLIRERENAGAQRREAQLKREAGSQQATKQNVALWMEAVGLDPAERVVDERGRDLGPRAEFMYTLAQANAAQELAAQIPEAILHNFTIAPDVRERALQARENGDWDGYVSAYVTGAVESALETRMADYRKQVDAENAKWRATELKALRAEQAPRREGALPTPTASAPKGGPTPAEYEAASFEQRQQWRREGVEPVLA